MNGAAPPPEAVFAGLRDRPGAVWLDGADLAWSVLAWDPVDVVTDGADWPATGRRLAAGAAPQGDAPFAGGCLGYLGFGAGCRVAPVPGEAATPEPEVWLARYRGGLCFDPRQRRWYAAGELGFVAQANELLAEARTLAPPPPARARVASTTTPRDRYEADVERILELIRAGDCYQVNLSRPVVVPEAVDPWDAYRRLRAESPAAYGAFLRIDRDLVVASNSPESFLELEPGSARSRPIKGTRPRGADPGADDALRAELGDSLKDRAELAMIVDLVRNDLGRVAVAGGVRTGPRRVDAHASVFHASQEVAARLEPDRDAWDALAACFPPGSVTGAPKVRACQRIAELEPGPRGVYCGAIGFVDHRGHGAWSVAIRTAVFTADQARFHVGGGIVADSRPAAEWDETVVKGRPWSRALGVTEP